jgi:hypothetical protein
VLGERLLLTRRQSFQLSRMLEASWSRAGSASGDWLPGVQGELPVFWHANGNARQTLSYQLPGLPDADWTVILRPAQLAYWQGLHELRRANAHLAVAERLAQLAQRAAIQRVDAKRRPPAVVEDGNELDHDAVAADELHAEKLADRAVPALPEEAAVLDVAGSGARVASFAALLLDDVDEAVELTESQRHKLLLAAKTDAKRYERRLAMVEREMAERIKNNGLVGLLADEQALVNLPPTAVMADESSAFRKLLPRLLSDEQSHEFARVDGGRRRFAAEAAWRGALSALSESQPITSAQWSELILLSVEQLDAVGAPSLAGLPRQIKVPAERMKHVLDDDELATLTPLLGPLWEVEP